MSVLNGFPDSQQFRSRALLVGRPVGGFFVVAREAGLFVGSRHCVCRV